MRIVLTAQPAYSHLVPLVLPVARMLHDAGHEVAVATGDQAAAHVEDAGLRAIRLPNALTMGQLAMDPAYAGLAEIPELMAHDRGRRTIDLRPEVFAHNFIGVLGHRSAADLLDVLDGARPDLIVREVTEFGGYIAARKLGIPQAVLDIGPMAPHGSPEVLAELNGLRADFELPEIDDPWEAMREFRATVIPEGFYPEQARLEARHHYRPPQRRTAPLDPAVAALPDDKPLVLASLGSNAPAMLGDRPQLLETIIEALGEMPVTAVAAIGADREPADWAGPRPDNVHLTPFVQQGALLPAVDAFITHSGFNSTLESFDAGVPMVSIPMFAEQPGNAARITELGAGLRLNVEDVTTARLRDALQQVLEDPGYRARARGVQRRMLALPPLSAIVDDLVAHAS
ncbi:hypothetical protein GCM10009854_47830 [Saccharopolyspora halophila]|uniref:N-glycosyltransferase n=1 Tax=Saccharopolyspora halophila TaxID=405551 RepID=A0ABP5TVA0_9PSEU